MGDHLIQLFMTGIYIAGDNIITSLGFTTRDVIHSVGNNLIGLKISQDKELASNPVPLSLVDSEAMHKRFNELVITMRPDLENFQYTRMEKMFILSIHDAISQAGIDLSGKNTILVLSSTKGNIDLLEEKNRPVFEQDRLYLWKMACVIRDFFRFQNIPLVVSNACISGVVALGFAYRLIESRAYDHAIVAGGDILSEFVISGFHSFQALSPEPCRPYDVSRNGLSLGEGCGTMVLTSTLSSFKGSTITINGMATSNDANHISGPSRTGEELAMAIRNAMKEAHLGISSLDYISAHGTATIYNDEMESKSLNLAGIQHVPVNSFKGYWGHTLGAAGIIESVAAVHSMTDNVLFRSAGFNEPGVPEKINVIRDHYSAPVHNVLKIASGFGGCNAAIVFRKN